MVNKDVNIYWYF